MQTYCCEGVLIVGQCVILQNEKDALQQTLAELDLSGLQTERDQLLKKLNELENSNNIGLAEHQDVCEEYQQKLRAFEV